MHKKIEFYNIRYSFIPLLEYDKSEGELKSIFVNKIIDSIKPGDQHLVKYAIIIHKQIL